MDDHRFDAIVRSIASGGSRRQVLKGLLGFGGAVAAGRIVLDADAARRPEPTPKPVKCPQGQSWDGANCVCDSGETCGSDCCLGESTCCDNACCYGYCYGEELCCPAEQAFCEATGECCPPGTECCGEAGCQESCCGPKSCGGACGECEDGQVCQNGLCFWTCTAATAVRCDDLCGSVVHACLETPEGGFCVGLIAANQCSSGCQDGAVCVGPHCASPC